MIGADQVLVGRNNTRRAYNMRMRERRGFSDALPMAGDKLVCLRNNRRKGLFNGGLWQVKQRPTTRREILKMHLTSDENTASKGIKVSVRHGMFQRQCRRARTGRMRKKYDEFDYGYVLTVHKAQGSQWDDVVLVRRELCVSRQPRALALHRHHARRENTDGCGVTRALIDRHLLALLDMKAMQHAMKDRRQHEARAITITSPGKDCVAAGEYFSGGRLQFADRTHAGKNHRCIHVGIGKRHAFEIRVTGHPDNQPDNCDRNPEGDREQHALHEAVARNHLVMRLFKTQ